MSSFTEYFSAIGRTVATIGEGLAVTGSYFLRKSVTLQYPDRMPKPMPEMLPARMRGMLEVDVEACTGCGLCEKTCPIAVIEIGVGKGKERLIERFEIDMSRCMHCGLCSECCPTEAIHHTREFEGGTYNPDNLRIDFVEKAIPVAKPPKKGEPALALAPSGSVLRRLMPAPNGERNTRQIEASKVVLARIDKLRAEMAAAAKVAAEKAAADKAAAEKAAAEKAAQAPAAAAPAPENKDGSKA